MIGTGLGLGLAGYRINPAGVLPVLDINFRDFKTFSSAIGPTASFSRASSGTYFDETGVLRTASTNVGRINHVYNGSTWVCKGGLIEEQRTNLANYSEDFTVSTAGNWNDNSNLTITANQGTAPDNSATADLVRPTASGYNALGTSGKAVSLPNSGTVSIYAKASGKNWLKMWDANGFYPSWFNLATGTLGTVSSGFTALIQNVGNGWYRCSVSRTLVGGNAYLYFGVSDADNSTSASASGTDGILVWGAQLETGSFPTSYIPTTSASATRSADVMQITGSNFSGFYNASEGSVCFEGDSNGSTTASDTYFLICSDGSTFNNAAPFIFSSGSSNSLRHRLRAGGSDIFNITTSEQLARNTPIKLAQGYKTGDTVLLANGSIIDSRTNSFSTSSISTFYIGQAFSGSAQINGHIARLRYWNTRLDNATLRALST